MDKAFETKYTILRCMRCHKVLARAEIKDGKLEIKCKSCKLVNTYDVHDTEAK